MLTVAKVIGSQPAGYAGYRKGKTTASQAGTTTADDGERIEPSGRWISGATAVGRDPAARATCVPLRMLMDVCRAHVGTTLATGASRKEVSASDARSRQ